VEQVLPPRLRSQPTLDHGVRAAAACNGVLLVWLYAVAAPTKDIRVRIPILVNVFSGITWLELMAIGTLAGLIGLALTGGWSKRAVAGVAVGAFLSLALLESGLVGWIIPAGYDSPPKYWLFAAAVLAASLALWPSRRQLRNGNDRSTERAV